MIYLWQLITNIENKEYSVRLKNVMELKPKVAKKYIYIQACAP